LATDAGDALLSVDLEHFKKMIEGRGAETDG
jgi:hypothetical protein